jgi:isopentenyl diphosphate isomerase/L-lactate dehydrogenase-like FMN-dependent dehydrogenase
MAEPRYQLVDDYEPVFRAEIENAVALTGCRSIEEIGRELVGPAP